jgi:hypothetical protein
LGVDGAVIVATMKRRALKQNVRKGPRKPVYVDGVRLGKLALWS